MQLIFHGGAKEVGRSCIELRSGLSRYLLDCGMKFHAGGVDYPAKVFETRTMDAIFLSHAHLDHAGGIPFFEHYGLNCPIICSQETKDLVRILLKDSHRINRIKHLCEAFSNMDLKKGLKDIRVVPAGEEQRFRNLTYTLFNAGHIPGSRCIKINVEGMELLYTGDFNTEETQLLQGADPASWGKIDILMTEATYGNKEHPDRRPLELSFLDKTEEIIARGGSVLVPVFALGRAQEMLVTLSEREWKVPIYMDGLAKKITRAIIKGDSPYLKHRASLEKLYQRIRLISSSEQRKRAMQKQGIFVTTSGMLQGGPSVIYLKHLAQDERSGVLLTGFQAKNTKGWFLAEQGTVKFDGKISPVKCEVHKYDFSAHAGMTNVEEVIRELKPKIVIFVHGAPDAADALKAWAEKEHGIKVYAPKVGEQLDILDDGKISQVRVYTTDEGLWAPEEHQHGAACRSEYDDFEWDD